MINIFSCVCWPSVDLPQISDFKHIKNIIAKCPEGWTKMEIVNLEEMIQNRF